MIYSSANFFVFFLLVATLYLLVGTRSLRFAILLGSSLAFYAWTGWFDTLIFLMVVLYSWSAVFFARSFPKYKKSFIALGILGMVVHLFFWKYAGPCIQWIQSWNPDFLSGVSYRVPLPIGISFFTLQGIAYLVDFANDSAKYMNFPKYLLFKSFFPQLVAGPIVRAKQLLPQIEKPEGPQGNDVLIGVALFFVGFFKKVLIADRISPFVDPIFHSPPAYSRQHLWLALLGYSVQIWADFSGYTDMGRGVARILGFKLPENFLSPYLSRNPTEFWRRWHVTLSEWIKDYIYIPLGGSGGGRLQAFAVVMLTMALSGAWHGAAWTFVFWGIYHGGLLIGHRLLQRSILNKKVLNFLPERLQLTISIAMNFFLVTMGWLIFRAQDLQTLCAYFKGLVFQRGVGTAINYVPNVYAGLALCLMLHIMFYFDLDRKEWLFQRLVSRSDRLLSNDSAGWLVEGSFGVLAAIAFAGIVFFRFSSGGQSFIYFQF